MFSQGLDSSITAEFSAFSTDSRLVMFVILLMLFGMFLPMQCCCKRKKKKKVLRPQPGPVDVDASTQSPQQTQRQSGVKKVVKSSKSEKIKPSREEKGGSKSKSSKGPEMVDERKEEREKALARTAVGIPKMKDDKHEQGMADDTGYMTLDKLDRNIFTKDLPRITPKLGPPKPVDETPKEKGLADGADYQTLGNLDKNIFLTAKIEKKKGKGKSKNKQSETYLTQETVDNTDETEHTEAESTIERTKSEEVLSKKTKKKTVAKKKQTKISSTHKKKNSDTKKKKKHHHHKKSNDKKNKSQPSLVKEDGRKDGMASGGDYETLSNLDQTIYTKSATKSSPPSNATEDEE